MLFKRLFVACATVCFFNSVYADQVIKLNSPDGHIQLGLNSRDNGDLVYQMYFKRKTVIAPSGLGFTLNTPEFSLTKFDIVKIDSSVFDETWRPVWGEQSSIRNHYKELKVQLKDRSGSGIMLTIIFRVFNNGVGFRYQFPKQEKLNHFIIADELTQFAMSGDHKTFWIPGDYDSNEFAYYTTKLTEVDATGGGHSPGNLCENFF